MEFVAGAMSTLLPKLEMLLTEEYNLQKSLRGEIMFLKAELETMHAAMERASEGPVTNNLVNIWANDVRELSYDIEDSIDKFMVRIGAHPSAMLHGLRGFIDRSLRLLTTAKVRHQIATDIQDIKTLVKEVAERRERYKVVEGVFGQPTPTNVDPRLHGIYEQSTKLVAIDGPREELTELLSQEGTSNLQLKVISIVGVGGLGKTTLANVMYQQLKGHFECNAFVPVSQKPDMKRILSSILRQASQQSYTNIETWDVVELINKIRQVLEHKKYFIIIDDIWDESSWNCIKCAFVENNSGSRVITTTRIAVIASSCCAFADGMIYKLKPLSHDGSKKLFYKRIFGREDGYLELKETSEKILRKCCGVPLAIITIASLLANKPININHWNSVHDSIGSGLEKHPGMESMRQILSTSYYDLPFHLKSCLLYLSVFPEDYNILRDLLIRRWIAESFIHGNDVVVLYKQAESYFNELINRSMIQPENPDARGSVGACHVHDMMLDLITSLSAKENFVTTLHGHQPTYPLKKIRRLSLHSNDEEHSIREATMDLSHVRSLIVFPGATNLMPPFSSFHVLRVLDLEGCHDVENRHISSVGNLFHLRYLGLRDTNITNLPNEIGHLYYLETLDLSKTRIYRLPPTVAKLRKLVCLYIEPSVMLPDGIGNIESLQLLRSVGIGNNKNFTKELGHLTELRILHMSFFSGAWHESYNSSFVDSLCKLKQIQELNIHSPGVSTEFIVDLGWAPIHLQNFTGTAPRLPRWMNSSLLDLSTLEITLNIVRQEDLQVLGTLPSMQFFCLTGLEIDSTKDRLVISIDCAKFICLSEFHFHNDKMGLIFEQGAMPKLENLELIFTVRERKGAYGDFDLGLMNLSSVNHVIIRIRCTGSKVSEVEDADSSMRMQIEMNSVHPKLDVIRYYEDEMIEDEERLCLDEDTLKGEGEEDQEFVVHRSGPWGGDGGITRDITVAPKRLESIQICSAVVVDAFGFSYQDQHGTNNKTPLWGGVGGSVRTINLGPSEYVMEVSGTYGPFSHLHNVITSLTIVTNLYCYGPFGQPNGTPFRTRAEKSDSIVGFFGRSETYLDAIGVYITKL
ncbi:hypothetical protein BS78_05G191500 [Paspalum vaginatum]|nr:hypothetical protein BS78_05G191500 [Paspalum vaginatum]